MIDRRLAVLVLGTALGMFAREANADDAACQAVLDAVIKQATIPVHQKISIESAAAPGKALQSEMIRTDDTLYMQVRGQWTSRPMTARRLQTTRGRRCRKRTTTARAYVAKRSTANLQIFSASKQRLCSGGTESQIWISHASGLPLRQHTVMLEQGNAKGQHDVRFDYADVTAPTGVPR